MSVAHMPSMPNCLRPTQKKHDGQQDLLWQRASPCVCLRSGALQRGQGPHYCCCCCCCLTGRSHCCSHCHSHCCSRHRRRPRATTVPASCLQAARKSSGLSALVCADVMLDYTLEQAAGSLWVYKQYFWLTTTRAPASSLHRHEHMSSGLHGLGSNLLMSVMLLHSTQIEYSWAIAGADDVMLSMGPGPVSTPYCIPMRCTC